MALRLTDLHLVIQGRLRSVVRAAVSQLWRALGHYDENNVEPFIAEVVPIVFAAQERSIALTDAYIAQLLEREPLGIDPGPISGENLRGVDAQTEWRRPFIDVWSQLQRQTEWRQAVDIGETRAVTLADTDVQLAHKAAYGAIQDADPSILGYQRRTDANPCDFCRLVEGAYVKRADAFPLHNHCECGLEPLTEIHPRAVFLPDGTRIRENQFGPLLDHSPVPEGVAIEEHGELGPVLVDPAHAFLGQSDIAA